MTYKSESLLITQQLTIATLAYNLLTQSLTCINLANPFGVHASGLLRHFLISSESQLIDQHLTVNSLRVHEGKWGFRLILRCFFLNIFWPLLLLFVLFVFKKCLFFFV